MTPEVGDDCDAAIASLPSLNPGELAMGAAIRPDSLHMVPVPGGEVFVRVNGQISKEKAPIVFLHGGPGSSHWYFLNATALADQRAVVLYDQLDSGRSSHPGDPANWEIGRFVGELDSIRSVLGIQRWHVLGTGWGATVAFEYALKHPVDVASLILSSPVISTDVWLRDCDRLIGGMPEPWRKLLRTDFGVEDREQCALKTAIEAYRRRHVRRFEVPQAVKNYREAMPASFNPDIYHFMWGPVEFRATGTLRDYDATGRLEQLDGSRTMFVAGEFDEAIPWTVARFAHRAGAAFYEVPRAARLIMNDNPEAYIALLRRWLATMDQPVA